MNACIISPCGARIFAFMTQCGEVADLPELVDVLERFCEAFGFQWYSLAHMAEPKANSAQRIRVSNYPTQWWDDYDRRKLHLRDPIASAAARTATSVRWHDIARDRPAKLSFFKMLADLGLRYGISTPVRIPGEFAGIASFAGGDPGALDPSARGAIELFGLHAFEAARRLAGIEPPRLETGPLTPRQIQCLTLVAQGKSDWEAGQILGLSDQTVHAHIESVRQRLGARRRTQLVVEALFNGQLSFEDVLGR